MNSDQLHRDLGRVEAKLDAHSERLERLESKLDPVVAYINRHKGAILVGSGVMSAAVAFLTAWFVR